MYIEIVIARSNFIMLKDIKLQNIVFNMDLDSNFLYYPELIAKDDHGKNPFCYDPEKSCHILKRYDTASLMTYFNCLQVKRWKKYTDADNFKIKLTAKGKFSVEIYEVYKNSSNVNFNLVLNKVYCADEKSEISIDIPSSEKDLVGFRIIALEDTEVYSGYYTGETEEDNVRDVKISLVTTTFRKQQYIKRNIAQLKKQVLCEGSDLKGHIFVHVIDNERALDTEKYDCEDLKIYPNDNVGGAGGFTRGMIEALELEKKPTHVLLMDDDVMIMSESLFRTYYLLRLVKPEYSGCFLSGAMFDYDLREKQYEDVGYVHKLDASYGPLKPNFDMRFLNEIVDNEGYADRKEENSYAGWWYCCIPVQHIEQKGLPLPVFVRGDDVEFSIRNNPGFITLNGICIWHVGFAGKFNAAMELYQVHRNSFVIQAASGICKDVDFFKRVRTMFWKEITRFAYNNAELLLDSIEDFMKGPDFLEKLNGEQSLKEHNAKNEKLVPLASLGYPHAMTDDPYSYTRLNIFSKVMYVLTINGHLLPNFMLRNHPSVIAFDWFFVPGKNFRRKRLIAVNPNDSTGCLRTINRKRCFALIKRYKKVMNNYKKNHVKVEQQYKEHFSRMTTKEFWKEYLGI